jgi:hypothetical protein
MLASLDNILSRFLEELLATPPALGGGDEPGPVGLLRATLVARQRGNDWLLGLGVVACCVLFALGCYLTIAYRGSPRAIGVLFGGSFLGMLSIVWMLRRLWLEKSLMDFMSVAIDKLPAADVAKLVDAFLKARTK